MVCFTRFGSYHAALFQQRQRLRGARPVRPALCKPGRDHKEFEEAANQPVLYLSTPHGALQEQGRLRVPSFVLPYLRAYRARRPRPIRLTTLRENKREELYELSCPPDYEAQLIDYAGAFAVLVDFEAQLCPTKVIGADPTLAVLVPAHPRPQRCVHCRLRLHP